ncbi:MAG: DUF86 domain-containing protein [Alphaproteobacteria bacterium]|nr:DUF86 domain-containing protein [Alphaproteobacteria bacterium]
MNLRSMLARLTDIYEAINAIENHLLVTPLDMFETNSLVYRAVERELEIISEASRHIADEEKNRFQDIEWRKMADLGNQLRHAYQRVDPNLLKQVIRFHLPALERAVGIMLEEARSLTPP